MDHVIVTVGKTSLKVMSDGSVTRCVRGEWKPLASGKMVDQARRLASNLRAIRESEARREARRKEA